MCLYCHTSLSSAVPLRIPRIFSVNSHFWTDGVDDVVRKFICWRFEYNNMPLSLCTYIKRVEQLDWMLVDRRHYLLNKCKHRPCVDPYFEWAKRVTIICLRLKTKTEKNGQKYVDDVNEERLRTGPNERGMCEWRHSLKVMPFVNERMNVKCSSLRMGKCLVYVFFSAALATCDSGVTLDRRELQWPKLTFCLYCCLLIKIYLQSDTDRGAHGDTMTTIRSESFFLPVRHSFCSVYLEQMFGAAVLLLLRSNEILSSEWPETQLLLMQMGVSHFVALNHVYRNSRICEQQKCWK